MTLSPRIESWKAAVMTALLIYETFVKVSGSVEIRWIADDPDYFKRPEDLFDRQTMGIPEDMGKKDKFTTVQAIFYCLLCECELKSIATLRAHTQVAHDKITIALI